MSVLVIGGCAPAGSALEPTPAEQASRPSDPVGARDAVLAYLTENYTGFLGIGRAFWPDPGLGPQSFRLRDGDRATVILALSRLLRFAPNVASLVCSSMRSADAAIHQWAQSAADPPTLCPRR